MATYKREAWEEAYAQCRCFAYVTNWVKKRVRQHLMRARNRAGFGWFSARQRQCGHGSELRSTKGVSHGITA